MSRSRLVAALVLLALVGAGVLTGAGAQVATPGDTTTTTGPPAETTTTTSPPPTLFPGPTTTTTAPPATPDETPPSSSGGQEGGDAPAPPGTPQVIPPGFQALINSVKRSKANNTGKLLAAIQPLVEAGLSQDEAIAAAFGRFPVAGYANFVDDWWYPRFFPTFHLHEGTDVFAAYGTPVRAPADGVLRQSNGPVGGLATYVTTDDGTYFYMAHLSAYPPGQTAGQRVKVGDIVGFVGDSGDAKGGAAHVHFEVHPAPTRTITTGRGKNKVTRVETRAVRPGTVLPATDPKPYLDQWIVDALANIPNLLGQLEANRPRIILATGLTRRFGDGRGGVFAAPTSPSRDQILWASSASPSGGTLQLAQAEAAQAAQGLNWEVLARRAAAKTEEWRQADAGARAAAVLITPRSLVSFLGWDRG
jgi:murein DD-endopeptidase MepM/ murein hydrolase activator NlpD